MYINYYLIEKYQSGESES